ncbi:AraC family cel operon transcriptional repressor [Limimaricola variabilis]|uniref:AraC family cel operon transcriptional repressor n=1 Tax=Limimaricola variabilis TaxID=1492771 RepID=A0ABR6HQ78_9RHOB|nr:AraC family transcriptional regulator [Limimaricola variabilis]MBB3712711.1 AraC family cel operon transcriptional repressor [Limimaricola variabilis]
MPDAPVILRHADILAPGECAALTRAALSPARPALHGHDFFELAWVQNGRVRHHLPDGREDLAEGSVICAGPGHLHGLQGRGEHALVVSVTLHPDLVTDLARRHPDLAGRLFWSGAAAPVRLTRDSRQMAELNRAALRLERGRRDALGAEAFLLPIICGLTEEEAPLPAQAPVWLARACAAARDPAVFQEGAAGFARAAGKAHPHVSRSMRRFLDMSPSDWINAQRMDYAARRLTGSADSLAEIAAECGVPNLSHFHKLFREAHGQTPQRFRRARQRDVVQP